MKERRVVERKRERERERERAGMKIVLNTRRELSDGDKVCDRNIKNITSGKPTQLK